MILVSPGSAVSGYTIPNFLDLVYISISPFLGGGGFLFHDALHTYFIHVSNSSGNVMANLHVVLLLYTPWTFKSISLITITIFRTMADAYCLLLERTMSEMWSHPKLNGNYVICRLCGTFCHVSNLASFKHELQGNLLESCLLKASDSGSRTLIGQ